LPADKVDVQGKGRSTPARADRSRSARCRAAIAVAIISSMRRGRWASWRSRHMTLTRPMTGQMAGMTLAGAGGRLHRQPGGAL